MNKKNKAIKLAELMDTDKRDMQDCVRDIMASSKADANTAFNIAKAIRAKYLPKVAEDLGITEEEALEIVNSNTYDFNQSTNNNRSTKVSGLELNPNGITNGIVDEIGDKDNTLATGLSDELRLAINEALRDDSFAKFAKIEETFDDQDPLDGDIEMTNEDEARPQTIKQSNVNVNSNKRGESTMNQKELAQRKAQRNKLVKEAEDLLNASTKSFEHAPSAQMNKDTEYPTMRMKEDGSNSLEGATKEFTKAVGKAVVPTMNNPTDDLLLHEDIDIFKFDGTPSGGYEYTLDKDLFGFDVPSAGEKVGEDFAVPTQMPKVTRKTTVAQDLEDEEDETLSTREPMKFIAPKEDEMESEELEVGGLTSDEDFDIEAPSELPMGEDEDVTMDDGDYTPADVLDILNSFDDEQKQEMVGELQAWMQENETPAEEGMLGEELGPQDRESIASVLGPDFDMDKAEEILFSNLVEAGVDEDDISKLTYAQGVNLYHSIKYAQDGKANLTVPVRKTTLEAGDDTEEDTDEYIDIKDIKKNKPCIGEGCEETKEAENIMKAAQVREARLKTAFDIWSRIAHIGMISVDEIAPNVDGWMNEGLTVTAMVSQGNIMLRTAHQSAKMRTASAAKETPQVALTTTPAYTNANLGKAETMIDLKSALESYFTKPEIDK
jgi:hypothetical protein